MTTTGLRPQETLPPTRLPAQLKKHRKSSYTLSCATSKSAQRSNINALLQQKLELHGNAKFQSQCEEHCDGRKRRYTTDNDNSHAFGHNHAQKPHKYERKSSFKSSGSSSYEKNLKTSQLSTASESESSGSNSSELSGFKIVQQGKIVHCESQEEIDSPKVGVKLQGSGSFWHYASSVLVTGPNVKEISIPTFA